MTEPKSFKLSLFLTWMLQFTALTQQIYMDVTVGHDVTLPCKGFKEFHDECFSNAWLFDGPGGRPVTLFDYGNILSAAITKSDRLSVTASCSLVIKKVTREDAGYYTCSPFKRSGPPVTDSWVKLSVSHRVDTSITPTTTATTATTTTPTTTTIPTTPPLTTPTTTTTTTATTTTIPTTPPLTTPTTTTTTPTTTTPTTTPKPTTPLTSATATPAATGPGFWWRIIYVPVGLAALSVIVVFVNVWTRPKGYKAHCGKTGHDDDDDDEEVGSYDNDPRSIQNAAAGF